jgi:hypothetical protein
MLVAPGRAASAFLICGGLEWGEVLDAAWEWLSARAEFVDF